MPCSACPGHGGGEKPGANTATTVGLWHQQGEDVVDVGRNVRVQVARLLRTFRQAQRLPLRRPSSRHQLHHDRGQRISERVVGAPP